MFKHMIVGMDKVQLCIRSSCTDPGSVAANLLHNMWPTERKAD